MGLMPFVIRHFGKGINQSIDSQLIGDYEAAEIQNCNIDDGNLSMSSGSTLYSSATAPFSITTLMKYFNGSSSVMLAAANGSIYKLNGTTFSSILGSLTSNDFDYINYMIGVNQVVIFGNGKENIKVYDGTTLRDLRNRSICKDVLTAAISYVNASGQTVSGIPTVPYYIDGNGIKHQVESTITTPAPKCSLIEVHKERIYLSGDTGAPNRLYFSDDFDPDNFQAPVTEEYANTMGGFIDIPTFDEGSKIVSIKSLFDEIMVFKRKSVHRLFGSSPSNFAISQIFNTVNGEIIDKTIAALDNRALWTSNEGIYIYDGVNIVDLTKRVLNEWNKVNKAAITSAKATVYKNKYILALPEGASTVNNLVIEYDIKENSFVVKRGMTINSFIEFNGELLYTANDGKLYKYGVGTTWNGALISSYWLSKMYTFDRLDKRKFVQSIHFVAKGSGSIRVYVKTDNQVGWTIYKDVALTATETVYKIRLRNKGKLIQFKIENINGADFTIKQPQINLQLQG